MSAIKIYTCSICGMSHEVGTRCPMTEAERSLAQARCSPAGRPTFPVAIEKDEFQAIENLAWMVKHSKQNVGLRMLDAAESVIKICKSKKPENS